MKIQDLLRGCDPGRIQAVGFMQVIPLVSDLHDDRFISPSQAAISTVSYGNIRIRNPESKPMIVPSGATYIVDQKAQNHALPTMGVVRAKMSKEYDTAVCVQSSQPGHISEAKHTMMLLPFPLREKAIRIRKEVNFRRLWPEIAKFNTAMGIPDSGGHLEKFFEGFREQLDTFIAQFEPIPNQVGAIILIGGKVVGIERTPSPTYFESIWRALIRECYGSLALMEARRQATPPVPKTRVALRKVINFGDLRVALKEAISLETDRVSNLVDSITKIDLNTERDEGDSEFTIEGLACSSFVGQSVRDSEKVVYASLMATEHWRKNEDWLMARPFSMRR